MPDIEKQYYEGQELTNLVKQIDWPRLLPILYASTRRMIYKRFLCDPDKGIYSKTFKDFVQDAVTLFIEGKRRCPKDIKLEQFFLTTIRSIISKHIGKHIQTLTVDASDEDILKAHYESMSTTFDLTKIKSIITAKLGTDQISIDIFDCWTEGISKPADIRELYGHSEPDYNNAKKDSIEF